MYIEWRGAAGLETVGQTILVILSASLSPNMSFETKFQAGESYGDATKEPAYSLDDPVHIAKELMKELVSVKSQVTLPEVVEIIQSLVQKPLDDKKGYVNVATFYLAIDGYLTCIDLFQNHRGLDWHLDGTVVQVPLADISHQQAH